tara:strand:+ start:1314 stop:1544 length:231 start_codon:yes stop_codon:yes gene_type:complete
MNIKSMLIKLAEEQADKIEKEVMKKIESESFAEDLAQKLNDKYDIPFVKEEKEGKFFLSVIGIMQSMVTGLIKSKK